MNLPAFDTHAYVKKLTLAGFTEKQSEALISCQTSMLTALAKWVGEKFSTKEDLLQLKYEIEYLKVHMDAKFTHLYWMLGFFLTMTTGILVKVLA